MFWHFKTARASRRRKGVTQLEHTGKGIASVVSVAEEMFMVPSDRAAIIVTLALLDGTMAELLIKAFGVLSKGTKNPLKVQAECDLLMNPEKSQSPPMMSATVRTRVAFVMGLIRHESFEALKYAYRIRNKCAHDVEKRLVTRADANYLHSRLSDIQKKFAASVLKHMVTDERMKKSPDTSMFLASCLSLWMELRQSLYELDRYH